MVLTKEENEYLARIGPGTPAGDLLRRYWYPIAVAQDLTDEAPTRYVRLLGEDLVVFRDRSGRIGLVADHCSHRGASLLYGRVEERGIACAYHGWLYDTGGNVLECPAEPVGSQFHRTIRHTAYLVREHVGLLWAYMGPLPAPEIPRYDVWARTDGQIKLAIYPRLDANWLQVMENTADPWHAPILHQEYVGGFSQGGRRPPPSTTRGYIDDLEWVDFKEVRFGIMKTRAFKGVEPDLHPLIFPNILRESNVAQVRVPVDDTHTDFYFIYFIPNLPPNSEVGCEYEVHHIQPYKEPLGEVHPKTRFNPSNIMAQDFMAWETQGPISDRTRERLATSDRCMMFFRDMLRREIDNVRQGIDPIAVVRDPDHAIIDTNLDQALRTRWYSPTQYSSQRSSEQPRPRERLETETAGSNA